MIEQGEVDQIQEEPNQAPMPSMTIRKKFQQEQQSNRRQTARNSILPPPPPPPPSQPTQAQIHKNIAARAHLKIKKTKSIIEYVRDSRASILFQDFQTPVDFENPRSNIQEEQGAEASQNSSALAGTRIIGKIGKRGQHHSRPRKNSSHIFFESLNDGSLAQHSSISEVEETRQKPVIEPPREETQQQLPSSSTHTQLQTVSQHAPVRSRTRTTASNKQSRREKLKSHIVKGVLLCISGLSSLLIGFLSYAFLQSVVSARADYKYTYTDPALPSTALIVCSAITVGAQCFYGGMMFAYLCMKFRGSFTCFSKQVLFLSAAIATFAQSPLLLVWPDGISIANLVYERFKSSSGLDYSSVVKMLIEWRFLFYTNVSVFTLNVVIILIFVLYKCMVR